MPYIINQINGAFKTHIVKSGDSIWTIVQKYSNVSVRNLKEWKDIWSANSLKPEMKLKQLLK